MSRILVIEDERDLAELIAYNIGQEGNEALIAHDGQTGLRMAQRERPDLVLLDLMLPGLSGIEVCRQLSGTPATAAIPVIMVTAKGEEIDRVVGFQVGADDYLVKPFSIRELLLRIRALLKRTTPAAPDGRTIRLGPLEIDTTRHRVTNGASVITLTAIEYRLLTALADASGRVLSREHLLARVWGYNSSADTRTVDTHIARLRAKLADAGELIRTIRGFGYKIEAA